MVNFYESPMDLAKLLIGFRNRPTSKTAHIARKCVLKVFNATNPKRYITKSLKFFGSNIRRATLLVLLSVQNFELTRNYDTYVSPIATIMFPALRLLLTVASDVEVLDLTGIVTYAPAADGFEHLEAAIIEVSEKATNLLSLSILQEESLRIRRPDEETLGQEYVDAFLKMEHLQVLRIEVFNISIWYLTVLCAKLRNLRFVSVNLYESNILMPDLKDLKSLRLLKAFFFRSTASMEEIVEFKYLCQMNLPNLQVIEDFASDFCCQSEYQYAPHKKEDRNLRHLCLNLQYEEAEEGVHKLFTCVTHLKIEGPDNFPNYEWQVEPLLKFSKIESLHLSHVPPEIVLQFVTIYGPNLHSLFLGSSICPKHSESSLDRIFPLCPKLQRVGLVGIEGPVIPKNDFTKEAIKEVILKSVSVSDILMAPNLEKVTLIGQVINDDDMRKLTDLISRKEGLRKLETLVVTMECNSITKVKQPFFLAMADFIKTAARVLPKLTDIDFRVNHMCNYVILAESMRSGRFSNDEISGVEPFFGPGTKFDEFQWFVDGGLIDTLNKFRIL